MQAEATADEPPTHASAPVTRSLPPGSSGGMTGLMTAALTADTSPAQGHQGQELRTLRGRAHLNTETLIRQMWQACHAAVSEGGPDPYPHPGSLR
jgi:hypothetical protein